MIYYLAEFVENTVRALRNGLSFADNFDCQYLTVDLANDTATNIQATKTVQDVIITRVLSTSTKLDAFSWYYDDSNRLTFRATFAPVPSGTTQVRALCLF